VARLCEDESVSVRRQAIATLAALGERYPANRALQETWLQCVLSRVKDSEKTVQTMCAGIVHTRVFKLLERAAAAPAGSAEAAAQQVTLGMVDCLDLMLLSCLQQAVMMLIDSGDITAQFTKALQASIVWSPHMATVAWALMQVIAGARKKKLVSA
jgi:hypothetical protein